MVAVHAAAQAGESPEGRANRHHGVQKVDPWLEGERQACGLGAFQQAGHP
jgi:hypothetical protein